jgi:hypothetical protein
VVGRFASRQARGIQSKITLERNLDRDRSDRDLVKQVLAIA